MKSKVKTCSTVQFVSVMLL